MNTFELQGHRGARGLRPENTLPSFEFALDVGVDSVETDVHLTADGVPVLFHDAFLNERMCRLVHPGSPAAETRPLVRQLTLEYLRAYRVDGNPDPLRFPEQQPIVGPLSALFAAGRGMDPFAVPTVRDLLEFVDAYAGEFGLRTGKTPAQQERAGRVIIDLELKRVPFYPETIADGFQGREAGLLEIRVLEEIRRANFLHRSRVRSFDHRSVAAIKSMEPHLETAVLVAETAPLEPGKLAREAGADLYCPDYRFVDADLVRRAHDAGVRVLPWTVNDAATWERLLSWNVDGITTDFPDRFPTP